MIIYDRLALDCHRIVCTSALLGRIGDALIHFAGRARSSPNIGEPVFIFEATTFVMRQLPRVRTYQVPIK